MAVTARKNKPFNLIHKEVQMKQNIKVERDWYVLFNILVVCVIVCLSIISFLFKATLESSITKKKTALANTINQDLNTSSKELLKSRINVIEDKSAIYRDFLSQNFDTNAFYTEISNVYPGAQVVKFIVQPNSKSVDVDLKFETKGYTELPKILSAIERHDKFKNFQIKGVTFNLKNPDSSSQVKTLIDEVNNSDVFITQISLSLDKARVK